MGKFFLKKKSYFVWRGIHKLWFHEENLIGISPKFDKSTELKKQFRRNLKKTNLPRFFAKNECLNMYNRIVNYLNVVLTMKPL